MGFNPDRLLVLRTTVPVTGPPTWPRASAFYRDVLPQLRAVPGVAAVGGVMSLPTQVSSNGGYEIEGGAALDIASPQAVLNVVTPDYFRAMRIPMIGGRDFDDGDRAGARMVAIVNQSLAQAAFPGQDPLGRRIRNGLDTLEFMTIVGVVADVRTYGPTRAVGAEIYMPYEQHPGPGAAMSLVVRPEIRDPMRLVETMRRVLQGRDADVPVRASTMVATLQLASATPRFRTYLLTVFAVVALLLAAAGIYGVMAYTVSQRTAEIGVRVALGASRGEVLRAVIGQSAVFVGVGLALGVVLALGAARLMQDLLFGVTPADPLVLSAVVGLMALVALAACYVPGRRALRVEPAMALRAE
jgi:predicted permease